MSGALLPKSDVNSTLSPMNNSIENGEGGAPLPERPVGQGEARPELAEDIRNQEQALRTNLDSLQSNIGRLDQEELNEEQVGTLERAWQGFKNSCNGLTAGLSLSATGFFLLAATNLETMGVAESITQAAQNTATASGIGLGVGAAIIGVGFAAHKLNQIRQAKKAR